MPENALGQEYTSGNWNHFFAERELPLYEVLIGLIRAHAVQPPRMLDIGCCSGRLPSLLAPD